MMKILIILGLSLVVLFIFLYDYSMFKKSKKKEKVFYIIILSVVWTLAALLILNPNMTGPSDWVTILFKPFSVILNQ